eukprot:GGOE01023393.1.p1 GENE.GGOE01023393.1~~GGOE01023393.1.p1  ORF type:complete len:591 (-),score=86.11 GGOE01023393.1:139-1803(-)
MCPTGPFPTEKYALVLVSFNLSSTYYPTTYFGKLLQRLGLEVDVAFQENEPLARMCRRYNFTVIRFLTPAAVHLVARQHHRFRRYSLLVWLIDGNLQLLPNLRVLPSVASILWAHGTTAITETSPIEPLLKFDCVWFANANVLHTTTWLVNPMGHQPPSFEHVGKSTPTNQLIRLLHTLLHPKNLSRISGTMAMDKPLSLQSSQQPTWRRVPQGTLKSSPELGRSHGLQTCPQQKKPARVAIALHLASRPVAWLSPVFRAMHAIAPITSHLWLTFLGNNTRKKLILWAVAHTRVVCHPMAVRNKGLDIGPFFLVLWQIMVCQYKYEYILKFHFKSDETVFMARNAVMFFHNPDFLLEAVNAMDRHQNWSTVYPQISVDDPIRRPSYDFLFVANNGDHMRELSTKLQLFPWPKEVLLGTIFLTRMDVFHHWLGNGDLLWRLYLQLNDIDGLDWRWYNRVYLGDRCDQLAIEWHFHNNRGARDASGARRFYGHAYADPEYRHRDGMVEHAWERVLSFMISSHGAIVPISVPYSCSKSCPSIRNGLDPGTFLSQFTE